LLKIILENALFQLQALNIVPRMVAHGVVPAAKVIGLDFFFLEILLLGFGVEGVDFFSF
jgi:hypothetical protein